MAHVFQLEIVQTHKHVDPRAVLFLTLYVIDGNQMLLEIIILVSEKFPHDIFT